MEIAEKNKINLIEHIIKCYKQNKYIIYLRNNYIENRRCINNIDFVNEFIYVSDNSDTDIKYCNKIPFSSIILNKYILLDDVLIKSK